MKTETLARLGGLACGACASMALVTGDARWVGALGGVLAGTLILRRASTVLDRLLEPDESAPSGPGLPVPTDPTPASPQELARLEEWFAELDAELRQEWSKRQRQQAREARLRDRVAAGPFEQTAWADLRKRLEESW